ncbi:putative pentatricopeptide repeat-containing protein At1g12700, mitochondrial [Pistacia vera]|uniref:putative pentatricopeptide repeat-containing protein At1g12700, mitochondrial n=1 Tax=Pistacia vera TaxID=55513 RepID=UPI0012639871|nr:putative pentatricopeptide repeat-containing protein At1g12700, mitochondrial [Pistacia vera]
MEEANGFLELMIQRGLQPNIVTYNTLMDGYCLLHRFNDAKELLISMESKGCKPYGFVVFGLILRRGLRPDVVTFTSLIKVLCLEKRSLEAMELFKKMAVFGVRPNAITYWTLIKGLCQTGNTSVALRLHEEMVAGNGEGGVICKPDIVSYGSMIDGLCKDELVDKAKELFLEMKGKRIKPDVVVFNSLIYGWCFVGNLEEAKGLFVEMADQVGDAWKLFDEMKLYNVAPDSVTYNILVDGICKNGSVLEKVRSGLTKDALDARKTVITNVYRSLVADLFGFESSPVSCPLDATLSLVIFGGTPANPPASTSGTPMWAPWTSGSGLDLVLQGKLYTPLYPRSAPVHPASLLCTPP